MQKRIGNTGEISVRRKPFIVGVMGSHKEEPSVMEDARRMGEVIAHQSMSVQEENDPRAKTAEQFLQEGCFEEAIGVYRELVSKYPERDSYLLALAWACLDGGQTEAAVDCFERLFERELAGKIFIGFAFDELVRIFKEKRQFDRLVAICEMAVSRYPADTGLLGELGHACLAAGRTGEAVETCRKVVAVDHDDAVSYSHLGDALMAADDLKGAEAAYCRAGEIDAGAAGSYFNSLAHGLLRAGAEEQAERAFRKCLEYSPEEPLYYLNLGDCLVKRDKLEEAEVWYEAAIKLNPASAAVYYNRLGNSFARACHHLRAAECFRKAIAADPGNTFYQVRFEEACTVARASGAAMKTAAETAGRMGLPE